MDSNKKVYVLTLGSPYLCLNVGTFLQHWALRNALKDLGYEPVRIPITGDETHAAAGGWHFYRSFIHRIVVVSLRKLGCKRYLSLPLTWRSFRYFGIVKAYKKAFRQHIGIYIEDTREFGNALILGGDQVLYEEYVSKAMEIHVRKRIVYAASTNYGAVYYNEEWKSVVKQFLQTFDGIGLRENAGVDFLNSLGIKSVQVADPVMLMDIERIRNIANNDLAFKKPTIFAYILNCCDTSDLGLDILETLSRKAGLDLKMFGIQGSESYIPNKYYQRLGPTELIKAIMDCDFFVTNSYHGTVLALMLHKPFVTLKQKESKKLRGNIRQQELLTWMGLENHWMTPVELRDKGANILSEKIEWNVVDKKFSEYRIFSLEWLCKVLAD